jgi:hypothetical protein
MAAATSHDILKSATEPWADIEKFKELCTSHNVTIVKGTRDNFNDGQVHYLLHRGDSTYELHANYWDYRIPEWQKAIDWIVREEI